jgi:competence protein ComEA
MKLKGVGRIRAQRIIDYRSSRGPFRAPEELRNVKGISQKILLDNRDRLTVGETE